jgi:galactokinase/mevalonate kinase-like predicted kinase
MPAAWDYLILTASNGEQARAYEAQLHLRRDLGQLTRVREALVVPDPDGKRVGSGGSTLFSLAAILERERRLEGLRILIVHAGGDSRRLPAYSPCGKIFVPVPGQSQSALGMTLFDRLVPSFLDLPAGANGAGQIVIATGDALLRFGPESARLDASGMTLLSAFVAPEEAARHGVYCVGEDGALRLYMQKPSIAEQAAKGAINRYGRTALDIGVMSFDAATATTLLCAFDLGRWRDGILAFGIDLYREICCAMGSEATFAHYLANARAAGSRWGESDLAHFYPTLHAIRTAVQMLPRAGFLHFGSTAQLVTSGFALAMQEHGADPAATCLTLNNSIGAQGSISGREAWVEGCRINAPLALAGQNVICGADVAEPLDLPPGACLDMVPIRDHSRWAVRCYGIRDSFKDNRLFARPLPDWLPASGDTGEDGTLWTARIFPAVESPEAFRRWLWMLDIHNATAEQKQALLAADRYSAAELAICADQDAFHQRRAQLRAAEVCRAIETLLSRESAFSAEDLAFTLRHVPDPRASAASIRALAETYKTPGMDSFVYCRIMHSLGTATRDSELCNAAFRQLNAAILASSMSSGERPRNALRADETIWGRGPARIELGGGWTDTPPYTLEYGGDVINVAVNLNGQPPIHCYCRVVEDPVIRLSSIDGGRHVEISRLEDLLDFQRPEDSFALAKAALAISGFSPAMAAWPKDITLPRMLEEFGGGIELTTLVGIPKGSGLGTSSILGAVIMAVVRRMMGRPQSRRELFHDVLRLEQALTTGGGWQDQIGGGVGGAKITSTRPGLFPDPSIHYVPADVVDPKANGSATLLYYTGLTRLAKNILQQVVGGYLNRDRAIMQALAEEHLVARAIADAMALKDAAAFGHYVNAAWELQKRLCGTVTNETIERLLARVRPHVHGMRISGAGSGGFLLMIAKSPKDAATVREMLEREPLNESARFFDFEINQAGLEVTTC